MYARHGHGLRDDVSGRLKRNPSGDATHGVGLVDRSEVVTDRFALGSRTLDCLRDHHRRIVGQRRKAVRLAPELRAERLHEITHFTARVVGAERGTNVNAFRCGRITRYARPAVAAEELALDALASCFSKDFEPRAITARDDNQPWFMKFEIREIRLDLLSVDRNRLE